MSTITAIIECPKGVNHKLSFDAYAPDEMVRRHFGRYDLAFKTDGRDRCGWRFSSAIEHRQ